MSFAKGKKALGICKRCGRTYRLMELRNETVDLNKVKLLVCPECFDNSHDQERHGRIDYNSPEALMNPRPDSGRQDSRHGPNAFEFKSGLEGFVVRSGTGGTFTHNPDSGTATLLGNGSGLLGIVASDDEGTPVSIDASLYNRLVIHLKRLSAPQATWVPSLSWHRSTDAPSPYYALTRLVAITRDPVFPVQMGDQFRTVELDLSGVTNWDGTVTGILLSITSGNTGESYEIDYIRFEKKF